MTTGERGRTAPDAEHYLDLPDTPDEADGPHFDVVLRGYDRAQVDEHVAGLRRMVAQLRAQLAVRERRRPGPEPGRAGGDLSATLQEGSPARDAPDAPPGPAATDVATEPAASAVPQDPDVVSSFNERLRGILQAAEQEAQMVRSKAAESLLAEHADSRAALADLRSQRDSVFDELMRVKGRLDDLVANSGRPSPPPRPWGPGPQRGPRGPYGGQVPQPYGGPVPPAGQVDLRQTHPAQKPPEQPVGDARSAGHDDAAGG